VWPVHEAEWSENLKVTVNFGPSHTNGQGEGGKKFDHLRVKKGF